MALFRRFPIPIHLFAWLHGVRENNDENSGQPGRHFEILCVTGNLWG